MKNAGRYSSKRPTPTRGAANGGAGGSVAAKSLTGGAKDAAASARAAGRRGVGRRGVGGDRFAPFLPKLIQIARGEVGVVEVGGNNCGARIREYQSATWLEPGPWPWCAAFGCWIILQWQLHTIGLPAFQRPRTAEAFDFERWAREQGFLVLPEDCGAKAGDIMIFDMSHWGLVVADQVGRCVLTIEGNTGPSGGRDGDEKGDGVWDKRRNVGLAKCFIRLCRAG